jgi:hypothetical protein
MEQAREALFAALGELEVLEEGAWAIGKTEDAGGAAP